MLVDRRALNRVLARRSSPPASSTATAKNVWSCSNRTPPQEKVIADASIGSPSRPGSTDDARFLAQLASGRLGQGLPGLGGTADREPERVIRPQRVPAVQQQHAPFAVDGQDAGGIAADCSHRTSFALVLGVRQVTGTQGRELTGTEIRCHPAPGGQRGPRAAATAARISRGNSGSASRSGLSRELVGAQPLVPFDGEALNQRLVREAHLARRRRRSRSTSGTG